MQTRRLITLILTAALLITTTSVSGAVYDRSAPPPAPAPASGRARIAEALQGSPLLFVENVGQFDAGARFQVRGGRGTLWLAEDALWITLLKRREPDFRSLEDFGSLSADIQPRQGVNLRLSFVGANPHPRLEPFHRLETHVSYFLGNDPAKWHPDVPVWGGVRYVGLYPGIDLELSGEGGQWQPRIVAQPGADLSQVRLRVEGADGVGEAVGQVGLTCWNRVSVSSKVSSCARTGSRVKLRAGTSSKMFIGSYRSRNTVYLRRLESYLQSSQHPRRPEVSHQKLA